VNRKQPFQKPTRIALVAAFIGVLIHFAIFFFIRIGVEKPSQVEESRNILSYLGEPDSETLALIDPLTLLVASGRERTDPSIADFRQLSISREITPFPPFLSLEGTREWSQWVPSPNSEENPGAWLLEQTESSLRNFGRTDLPTLQLPPEQMTLHILNLQTDKETYLILPLPSVIAGYAEDANFLSPASFLLDRSSPWSRPPALPIKSSGNLLVDRALGESFLTLDNGLPKEAGYFEITFYLPPSSDEPK